MEFGGEKRASRFFRLRTNYVLRAKFNMERSKIRDISEKRPKTVIFLLKILVKFGNLSNFATWIKNLCFLNRFYS